MTAEKIAAENGLAWRYSVYKQKTRSQWNGFLFYDSINSAARQF